jgi:hypothetical protein
MLFLGGYPMDKNIRGERERGLRDVFRLFFFRKEK